MIKTIYKIQWRIQTFREGGGGGGGGVWAVIQTLRKGGGGFPKTSGLSLF